MDDEEATKSILQDKDVIVIADESTDLKNRKVLNILLGSAEPNSKFRLVATKFLDEVNAAVVSSAIIDAIRNMGIPYDNVVCIYSDNAPYMIAAGRTLSDLETVAGAYFEVFKEESPKLTLYMSSKHPALDFWKDVQFFDPRKSKSISPELNALPASLKRFQTVEVPNSEFVKLRDILASYSPTQFCPYKFWRMYEREMPALSSAALRALSIPSSSAEVERSFSALRRLLTPQRSNFTEENLCSHLKLAFNKVPDVEELSNGSEMNSSSEEED